VKCLEYSIEGLKFFCHYDLSLPSVLEEDDDRDMLAIMKRFTDHPICNYFTSTERDDDNDLVAGLGALLGLDTDVIQQSLRVHPDYIHQADSFQTLPRLDSIMRPLEQRIRFFIGETEELLDAREALFVSCLGDGMDPSEQISNSPQAMDSMGKFVKPRAALVHQHTDNSCNNSDDESEQESIAPVDVDSDVEQEGDVNYADVLQSCEGKDGEGVSRSAKRRADKIQLLNQEYTDCKVKVVDLGNACWTYKHFTEDIQTRQYRSPEVIVGAKYHTSADMWSLGCIIFELLTGDLLFDPRAGKSWSREEDHLALIIELLGEFPRSLLNAGKLTAEFFTKKGELKRIRHLNFWSLSDVLREKYHFSEAEAKDAAEFLESLLVIDPSQRATAEDCLSHPWLSARSLSPSPIPGADNLFTTAGGRSIAFDDNLDSKSEKFNSASQSKYFESKHCS